MGQPPVSLPIVFFKGGHVTEDLFAHPGIAVTKTDSYRGGFAVALDPSCFPWDVHLSVISRQVKPDEDLVAHRD